MSDTLAHYHMFDYRARCAVAVTTEIVREAQRRHDLDPITTIAVGRAINETALLWKDGQVFDLNQLVDPQLHLRLSDAVSVNDNGQILAVTPMRQVVLLSPVPEPSSLAMSAFGILTLLARATRRRS